MALAIQLPREKNNFELLIDEGAVPSLTHTHTFTHSHHFWCIIIVLTCNLIPSSNDDLLRGKSVKR